MFQNKFSSHVHPDTPQSFSEFLRLDGDSDVERLKVRGQRDVGPVEVPTRWYLDREVHELEVERIWKKTWQIAGWAADIPEPGDTMLYNIAGISLVLVRAKDRSIRAYYNSCLHRGVTLRKCAGRVASLQCPFHGFTWSLEGKLVQVPSPHQFPDIDAEDYALPEAKVETWQGFIFVNLDPEAGPLSDFMGGFQHEFNNSSFESRIKVIHVKKIIPANWKAVQEAFMEGWHVLTTHPQHALTSSAQCSQHDAFENYSRGILPFGAPNEYMSSPPTQDQMFAFRMGHWEDDEPLPPLEEGQTARQIFAEQARATARKVCGEEVAERLTTSELVDTTYYTLYPNFHPFSSPLQPHVNIFKPYGDDHTRCEMDVMLFGVAEPDKPAAPAEPRILQEDEDFTSAPEMGFMAPFLTQDVSNLSQIMMGMRSNKKDKVIFARDYELQIRHFYSIYKSVMGFDAEV